MTRQSFWRKALQVLDRLVHSWLEWPCEQQASDFNKTSAWSEKSTSSGCYQEAGGQEVLFWGHSVAWVHSNLSPMRYMVGHSLHVFAYIPLTRVQLFIDKPRPYAQIEIDAGAHVQLFTAKGIPWGTEVLSLMCVCDLFEGMRIHAIHTEDACALHGECSCSAPL